MNYVTRPNVDGTLTDNLSRRSHIVIYGSSKQGKTSLRKYCLKDGDYDVVSCQNRWTLAETHSSILKEVGYSVAQSTAKTVTGAHKITAVFEAKSALPFVAHAKGSGGYEGQFTTAETITKTPLELDPSDVNDIIRALRDIDYKRFIVLEDFHYLPMEAQKDMAFSLKAFHEKSDVIFIIVGVWREENRLITFNGDLTDRVFAVDVDAWTRESLREVVRSGEMLLNVQFDSAFLDDLLDNCFDSVHLVQEVCRLCLRSSSIFQTCDETTQVGAGMKASSLIAKVVDSQGGRYNGFLMNFADGFQQTDLEMPKWIVFAILKSTIEQLRGGLRLREITKLIRSIIPRVKI